MNKIRTRFAPSPTGKLHLGNYRTALFSWLYAKKHKGEFVLRIEDTDKARSQKAYEDDIIESLAWLDLDYVEKYRQSENVETHKRYLQDLLDRDLAYISKEEEGDRNEVIRFRNPNKKVAFRDIIRGEIVFDTTDLGDFVIAKSIDEPVFHLAVVIDDYEEGITHVFRGEDHISNTPRHILLQEAIGAPVPAYLHLPLVLNKDREKLSKRKGAKSVLEYRDEGFMPESLINYMALLGWNPGTEQEIFSRDELIDAFDIEKIHKGGAIFDEIKLRWVNKEHMKRTDSSVIHKEIMKYVDNPSLIPLFIERIDIYSDIPRLIEEGEIEFFYSAPKPKRESIIPPKNKDTKGIYATTKEHLMHIRKILVEVDTFDVEAIKNAIWDYATEKGRGEVLWPMRYALTGKDKSPDPFTVASVLGKDETIKRLDFAIELL